MRVAVAIRRAQEAKSEGGRVRYPLWTRMKAVSYIERRAQSGVDVRQAAAEIGLSAASARRWLAESKARQAQRIAREETRAGFVQVAVRDEEPQTSARSPIVVRGPGGLEIEGLDMDGIVELLRRAAE